MERLYTFIVDLIVKISTLDYVKMLVFTIFSAYIVKFVRGKMW